MVERHELNPNAYHHKDVWDYDSADRYLKGGRDPNQRPLYDRGLNVYRSSDRMFRIYIAYYASSPIVIYEPGDVVILPDVTRYYTMRPSTRRIIRDYANIDDVSYAGGKYQLYRAMDERTPSSTRRCRSCSGLGHHVYTCTGYNIRNQYRLVLTTMGKKVFPQSCTVGDPDKQGLAHRESMQCNNCSGTGKVIWGNKAIPTEWDGKELILDIKSNSIVKPSVLVRVL
jgi:hypothetical protein